MSVKPTLKVTEPMREAGSYHWVDRDTLLLGLACGHEVVHHPSREYHARLMRTHPPAFSLPQACPICGDINYALFTMTDFEEQQENERLYLVRKATEEKNRRSIWKRFWNWLTGSGALPGSLG